LKLSKKIVLNDKVFIGTQIIGIFSGVTGLFITFLYPENIIRLHLWELLIMPYVIVQVYWLIIIRIKKTSIITDEKQEFDMSRAGGITFGLSMPGMIILFILYYHEILDGLIWFPYYLFLTIFIFSGSTLYFFKKV